MRSVIAFGVVLLALLAAITLPSVVWALVLMTVVRTVGAAREIPYRKALSAAWASLFVTGILYVLIAYTGTTLIYPRELLRNDFLLAGVVKLGWWSPIVLAVAWVAHAIFVRLICKTSTGRSALSALVLALVFSVVDHFLRDWAAQKLAQQALSGGRW